MGLWSVTFMMAAQAVATMLPTTQPASAADNALLALVSVERIHEGLQRPALKIPPPVEFIPVFRATVDERLFENPLQGMRRELTEDSGYRGKSGVDVLALATGMVKSIRGVYRAYSEARIRKEVDEALAVFCAQHDCSVLADGPPPMEGIVLPRRNRD
jgi:hypothetical protein